MGVSLVFTLTRVTETKCIFRGGKKIYRALCMERKEAHLFPFPPIKVQFKETAHIQRQRSPTKIKIVGAGATAVWCWSDFEEIPHVQGQRRSPSKTVGGVKSHLESNPIPATDAQRAQTYLAHTRTQRPYRDWDRTVSGCLLRRYRSAVDCCGGRGSGCSRSGYDISPLGGGHH